METNLKILVTVHGFNVRDNGAGTTDLFRAPAERLGYRVVEADRGFEFLAGARSRFLNEKRARDIVEKLDGYVRRNYPGGVHRDGLTPHADITGLGHSDGCRKLLEAAWLRPMFRRLIFINPALDADAAIPPEVRRIDVWHVPGDLAVTAAKYLLWHPWGDMGAGGYRGNRTDVVTNHNAEEIGDELGVDFPMFNKHSRIFERLDVFATPILQED